MGDLQVLFSIWCCVHASQTINYEILIASSGFGVKVKVKVNNPKGGSMFEVTDGRDSYRNGPTTQTLRTVFLAKKVY